MKTELRSTKQRSILVVDDDRELGGLIRRNLEDKITQVFEAATGLEGMRILRDEKVDLILLDLGLPDFNGWGILSLLKLTEPLRQIPVIVVSVEPANMALIEKLKPEDYIQKPFDMRDLLTRVKKLIDSRRANQPG